MKENRFNLECSENHLSDWQMLNKVEKTSWSWLNFGHCKHSKSFWYYCVWKYKSCSLAWCATQCVSHVFCNSGLFWLSLFAKFAMNLLLLGGCFHINSANCQQTAWYLILYVFFSVFSFFSSTCYFARY